MNHEIATNNPAPSHIIGTKERPILFNGEMVRAILEGRKTQTRRPVIPQPKEIIKRGPVNKYCIFPDGTKDMIQCPFGRTRDRLWVRETWVSVLKTEDPADRYQVFYRATDPEVEYYDETKEHCANEGVTTAWKPSIHMPRWASRITLEITKVKVERVNAISEQDAEAEGFSPIAKDSELLACKLYPGADPNKMARKHFLSAWTEIYGDESWDEGHWVWVIEFKRVSP